MYSLIYYHCLHIFLCLQAIFLTNANDVDSFKKDWFENINRIREKEPPTSNEEFKNFNETVCLDYGDYDFVIVGGGSAGSVVAKRLSENGTFSVLLLEAGKDETKFGLIPSALGPNRQDLDWGYKTLPEKFIKCGSSDGSCAYPRGKVLGGCSSINGMAFIRASEEDFEKWKCNWSYKEVLHYYKKSENASLLNLDRDYHGNSGPLNIDYAHPEPILYETLYNALIELGMESIDHNGGPRFGVSKLQLNLKNGKRFSTNQAYLKNKTKNLKVLTEALATKIYFNARKVTELKFLHKKSCGIVKIGNELILSAGVINTPQLLLLSGIGPKKHLTELGIPIIADLPVGKYLKEHPILYSFAKIKTNKTIVHKSFDHDIKDFFKGKGRLTYGMLQAVSIHNVFNNSLEFFYSFDNFFIKPEDTLLHPAEEDAEINVSLLLTHPKSQGELFLKTADPIDFPNIILNCLKEEEDVEVLYHGIQDFLRVFETDSFKSVNATLDETNFYVPDCSSLKGKAFWYCFIKNRTAPGSHTVGTCRMGLSRKKSVVNKFLMVHGINNLRIVDASVFPTHVGGHPHSTVVMIAEKISENIIEKYN